MTSSILDLYVLSLLDRGLGTPYSLQRDGGLSLGASTPALRRLSEARLVKRKVEEGATKRPRHVYTLTASGQDIARNGWRDYFSSARPFSDLDAVLRLADMAVHYGEELESVAQFLGLASGHRSALARRAAAGPVDEGVSLYLRMDRSATPLVCKQKPWC